MRLASGEEALVARVLARDGKVGFGFSFRLDATEAREMAEANAGLGSNAPRAEPVLNHPWEKAALAGEPIPWNIEPEFRKLTWLSSSGTEP
jgi:hypothetical protein